MRMYEEREFFTRDQIHNKAVQIFEDYIIEDCKWGMRNDNISQEISYENEKSQDGSGLSKLESPLPMEILREIRAGYSQRKIRFVLNNGLFSDLYIFSLERLRQYYE